MIKTRNIFLAIFAIAIISSSVQATYSTDVAIKTDVPYYDIAIRLINYVSEDVMGSVYLKTDSTGYAQGNFSSEESRVKITIIIYRDGMIYKQLDNYGVYPTGQTINLDLRENKNENNETNNSTDSGNNETNSTENLTLSTTSTTGNAISQPSATSPSKISTFSSNLWMYIAAGIILVGAVGFVGVRYVQQKGTMSGMSKYEKARGPIEEKPLFQEKFQPVSDKMDDLAAQEELRKAKDRIRNLERELTLARNAEKIKETERKIEEDKKRLDRLRRGESV